jgi:hypothetical protein
VEPTKLFGHLRAMRLEFIKERTRPPEEHPAVPQIVALGKKPPCLRQLGLFREPPHAPDPVAVRGFPVPRRDPAAQLQITEAGLGLRRLDADRDQIT